MGMVAAIQASDQSFVPDASTALASCAPGCRLDRLGVSALYAAAYGALGAGECAIDRSLQRQRLTFEDHARKTAQHHLDAAQLVDTAARPVHIQHTDRDAFDRSFILAELHAEAVSDMGALVLAQIDAEYADIRRNLWCVGAPGGAFRRLGQAPRE